MSIRLSRNSDPRLSFLTLDKPMRHFAFNRLAIVFSLVLLTTICLPTSPLAAQPPLTPHPGTFPIGCFPGPPAESNTLQNWQSIKDANFTLMCPVYRYDDEAQLKMLQHCEQLGLKAVVNVKIPMPNAETPLPDDWRETVQQYVARYARQKALFGYMLKDEPNAAQFGQIAHVAAAFREADPNHCTCINLFPIYASQEQLGTDTYEEHLEQFLTTVAPDFLCYDHYPFMKHGRDHLDFCENLELARTATLKHNKPLWIVILAAWKEHFRQPTVGEMHWQVYSSLAYGVKGIFYFTYWPITPDYKAVVDYKGKPGPLHEPIQQLNGEILQLGRTLLELESTAVYHTGKTIPQGCTRLPEGTLLSAPQDQPLILGFFRGLEGRRYAMIVNHDTDHQSDVELNVSPKIQAVSRIRESDGVAEPLKLQDRSLILSLRAGSGTLLQLTY